MISDVSRPTRRSTGQQFRCAPLLPVSFSVSRYKQVYTQAYNRGHGRVGHVLQGRFKSMVVDKDPYLLELACYIVLNPVRAGMTTAVRA